MASSAAAMMRPVDVAHLQRTAGNQAVAAVLQRRKAAATTAASGASVRLGEAAVPPDLVMAVNVDKDTGQPDMCEVHLKSELMVKANVGDAMTVAFGSSVFSGEVAGVEPHRGPEAGVVVRGFSLLHRLSRGRKSRVFVNKTERQIVEEIAAGAKLAVVYKGIEITSRHVYQHNQTDLEFVKTRAARHGSDVWVEGSALHVGPHTGGAGKTVRFGKGDPGLRFSARLAPHQENSPGALISGEAMIKGDPEIKPGMVVTLDTQDARFDGKYYVTGVSHRYRSSNGGAAGGFMTTVRVTRPAA